ncbi:APC family permease [Amycolatopsis sp. H20-H5]|uniref:APC family permease n=1 Tax=Amycolatopsis sp. H20-H5 TaxID=3046309 RepID=UPI002DBDEA52|nr:APC family permease [Amycolatopsis sp. H20-H5]MEC3976890.1 APC family permease [Amycolatopsis sp. H20-H5]
MTDPAPAPQENRFRRTLGTPKIVFLVISAAAPLAALVGTVPLAFAIGNGAGVPAMFVFAGLTLLCFSVGYAAMSRRVVNAGGFYSYLSAGLGRPPAVGGGLVAVISYNAITVGLAGAFAYFTQLIASSYGLDLPWQLWAALGVAAMAFLGYRQIDMSARVLSVLMIAEVAILLLLDVAVLIRKGGAALPAASFDPKVVLGGGIGISLMFALISFIGFESAALYGEESRNPKRSVPLATYASVILIGVFYALTSWIAVGAVGADQLQQVAGSQLGTLFSGLTDDYLGSSVTVVMQILLCTSLFAGMLAMHNAANRYLFVLGRDRVLPHGLSAVHAKHASPHRASLTQTAFTVLVIVVFAVAGLDPYVNLSTTMVGLGTLGIVALQAAAAVSVIGFFRKHPDRHWWRTMLAPGLGFAGLVASVVLVVGNFETLTGTTAVAVTSLPWLLVAAAAGGVGYGYWIRARHPRRYADLANVERRDVDLVSVPAGGHVAEREDTPRADVA